MKVYLNKNPNEGLFLPNGLLFNTIISPFISKSPTFFVYKYHIDISNKNIKFADSILLVEEGAVELCQYGKRLAIFETNDIFGCFNEWNSDCYIINAGDVSAKLVLIKLSNFLERINLLGFDQFFQSFGSFISEKLYSEKQPLSNSFQNSQVSRRIDLRVKKISKGETIINENKENRTVYYLCNGVVSVELKGKHINMIESNQFFGFFSVLLETPPIASVVAHSDVDLICIKDHEFFDLIGSNKMVAETVLKTLINVIKQQNRQIRGLEELDKIQI